jgi:hypothetical protein
MGSSLRMGRVTGGMFLPGGEHAIFGRSCGLPNPVGYESDPSPVPNFALLLSYLSPVFPCFCAFRAGCFSELLVVHPGYRTKVTGVVMRLG